MITPVLRNDDNVWKGRRNFCCWPWPSHWPCQVYLVATVPLFSLPQLSSSAAVKHLLILILPYVLPVAHIGMVRISMCIRSILAMNCSSCTWWMSRDFFAPLIRLLLERKHFVKWKNRNRSRIHLSLSYCSNTHRWLIWNCSCPANSCVVIEIEILSLVKLRRRCHFVINSKRFLLIKIDLLGKWQSR